MLIPPSDQQPFQKTPMGRNPKKEKSYSLSPMFLSNKYRNRQQNPKTHLMQ